MSRRQNPHKGFPPFFLRRAHSALPALRRLPARPHSQRHSGVAESIVNKVPASKVRVFCFAPRSALPLGHGRSSPPTLAPEPAVALRSIYKDWSEKPARPPGPPSRTSGGRFPLHANIFGGFFFAAAGALPDAGRLPQYSQTRRPPPLTSVDPRCTKRVPAKKSAAGDFPARCYPTSTIPRTRYAFATPPSLFFHPPPWFSLYFFLQHHLILDSLALSRISLALVNLSFVLPLILHHLPAVLPPSLDPLPPLGPAMSNTTAHNSTRAKFLAFRGTHPYANEGPGSCYNVACVDDADIALYRAGGMTGADLLARMTWKVGHSNDHERRQRDYGRCDVGQTHIWVCRWEVSRRYYCERLAQLEQLCDGGERFYKFCVCGVRHREYFTFSSVGGFAQFRTLMTGMLFFMNEPLNPVFYGPSPSTADIYDLIIRS
ncbi:hypothetical protein B0H13DRAFT_2336855 [Mycena leptocephala]|nr:hypothetical protein B0H13DRAFT_2336855 [Mycena leptocephala]